MNASSTITDERRAMRRLNSTLSTLEVLAKLKENHPEIWELAEVVGQWVWIEFPMKPSDQIREYLLDIGFHWNQKRMAWQHACGHFARHSPSNPRWKYACVQAKELETA